MTCLQAAGIADETARRRRGDLRGDLEALGVRAGGEQLDGVLDERLEVEWLLVEVEAAGLDLGEVEDLVDEGQQRVARRLDGLA